MYAQEEVKPYGQEGSKRKQVERMFDEIAHSYDPLNHTLSLGVDRLWRRDAINYLHQHATQPPRQLLDVATGTGDFALLAAEKLQPEHITGIDISEEMMRIGREKIQKKGLADRIKLQYEDCSCMSFADNQFDAVISSFGLRNFQNLDQCLQEMFRVLKPGGLLVAIDLCSPTSFPMKQFFWCYKHVAMPVIGRFISHDRHAYTYLPATMDAIPQGDAMVAIFEKAGFQIVQFQRQIFGMSMLYAAEKI